MHNPGKRFRGPVLIHASKGMTQDEYNQAFGVAMDYGITLPYPKELERGGIVGQAEVIAWHDSPPDMPFAFCSGLELRNAVPRPFVPCVGMLGFFIPRGILTPHVDY
jgi:hypothetical protein